MKGFSFIPKLFKKDNNSNKKIYNELNKIYTYLQNVEKKTWSHNNKVLQSLLALQEKMVLDGWNFQTSTLDYPSHETFCKIFNLTEEDHTVKFLDYNVAFRDLLSMYVTFKEIFLYEDYFIKFTKNNPYIIDCGSHVGLCTLYFKSLYPNSEILCFEPNKFNFSMLEKNIQNNNIKNVTLVNSGVGKCNGKLPFFEPEGMSMGGTFFAERFSDREQTCYDEIDICKLSPYLDKKVDFLKLDVEGVELDVLEECSERIKNVHYLFIEFHTGKSLPCSRLSKILDILDRNSFIYHISRSHSHTFGMQKKPFMMLNRYCSQLIYAQNTNFSE